MLRKALKVADGDSGLPVIDRMIRGLSMAQGLILGGVVGKRWRLLSWFDDSASESTRCNSITSSGLRTALDSGLNPDKMLDSGMTDLELQGGPT